MKPFEAMVFKAKLMGCLKILPKGSLSNFRSIEHHLIELHIRSILSVMGPLKVMII